MIIEIKDSALSAEVESSSSARGHSVDDFVLDAVREKLMQARGGERRPIDWPAIRRIQKIIASAPTLESASEDDIMGYTEDGTFGA